MGCAVPARSCELTPQQSAALVDPMRPIVLSQRRPAAEISPAIAPDLRELGLMLPYSPLHHLLLEGFGAAVVATSGNLSGEPVLTEPQDAEMRLADVAEGFLHHDRPIARPADDPLVRVVAGAARPMRLGRGTAPLELDLARAISAPTLAVGAFVKNTVALAWDNRVVVSPHIGELDSPRARAVFAQVAQDLQLSTACAPCAWFTTRTWASRIRAGHVTAGCRGSPSGITTRTRAQWPANSRASRRSCVSPGTGSGWGRTARSGAARRYSGGRGTGHALRASAGFRSRAASGPHENPGDRLLPCAGSADSRGRRAPILAAR